MALQFPKGYYMATVKVGDKGQIVIPKDAREMFHIQPGDTLLLMADQNRGIALVENSGVMDFAKAVFHAQEDDPHESN